MKKRTKIISIVLLSLLVIGIVGAVIAQYYGEKQTTIEVSLPILVTGTTAETINGALGCEQVRGVIPITIHNLADQEIDIIITSECKEGEEICDEKAVETSYVGTLRLTQKTVDFKTTHWAEMGSDAIVEYTVAGNSFSAEVIEGAKDGYVLIYYKDNSDRFGEPAIARKISQVITSKKNLPYPSDGNIDEHSYCGASSEHEENYTTCHGAKLWYIPENATEGGNIDWSMASQFLFETKLIQYNKEGIITMYPNSTLIINPMFDLDCMLEGTVVINTTIDSA